MATAAISPGRPRMPRGVWWGLLLVLAGLGGWATGLDARALAERLLAFVRTAGPWWYFGAMALLPLPLAWFTVPAGEAFAGTLTLGGVIGACLLAVAVQVSLSYALARHWLRPAVQRFVQHRGYAVPQVNAANAWSIAWLVRLTPGPPMFLGSCLLALAATPFRAYFVVSCLVAFPWICAGVILGRGLLQGNLVLAASGAGLFVAALLGVRLWRRRAGRFSP